MSERSKAHLAVLAANLFFGANFSIVKSITPSLIQPFALNVVRVVITSSLFWSLYMFRPSTAGIDRKDLPRFFLCAATGVAINQLLFIKGLSLTSGIHGALLMLATPIFITVIASIVLKDRLNLYKIMGLIMGVSGATILILSKDQVSNASNMLLGDILILINAIAYAFYLVAVRPLMQKYSPVHVIRWVFTIGTFMVLPFGLGQLSDTDLHAFSSTDWWALSFVVICGTFFAYYFNVIGVKIIGPAITGNYIYTQPVFATVIAMIFFGEELTLTKVVAALFIFTGVFTSTRTVKHS